MSALDPSRFKPAWRTDPSHRLPLLERGGRDFIDGETVDTHDPFILPLLADRSLTLDPPASDEPAAAPEALAEPAPGEAPAAG